MKRNYCSNCMPGEIKKLERDDYVVSNTGSWIKTTKKPSKKATHKAEVHDRKIKADASKLLAKLEKKQKSVYETPEFGS